MAVRLSDGDAVFARKRGRKRSDGEGPVVVDHVGMVRNRGD